MSPAERDRLIAAHRSMIQGHEEIIARLMALAEPERASQRVHEPASEYRGRALREPDTDLPVTAYEGN